MPSEERVLLGITMMIGKPQGPIGCSTFDVMVFNQDELFSNVTRLVCSGIFQDTRVFHGLSKKGSIRARVHVWFCNQTSSERRPFFSGTSSRVCSHTGTARPRSSATVTTCFGSSPSTSITNHGGVEIRHSVFVKLVPIEDCDHRKRLVIKYELHILVFVTCSKTFYANRLHSALRRLITFTAQNYEHTNPREISLFFLSILSIESWSSGSRRAVAVHIQVLTMPTDIVMRRWLKAHQDGEQSVNDSLVLQRATTSLDTADSISIHLGQCWA
ncbi:hypothetical protein C8Q75DRAFT_734288 [Abortiporus biennis]|nr:hypothetical protein C8Q75DRAFT_734288 [Abortiporus biennis]